MAVQPFKGNYPVTQGFGKNPAWYGPGGHRGIDYGTPYNTPAIAVANGRVVNRGFQSGGFGNHLTLEFGNYICYYAHLARVTKTGNVKAGDVIGYTNNTGWSTGNHLHFEVYENRKLINPDTLLKRLSTAKPKPIWPKRVTVSEKIDYLNVRTGPSTAYPLKKNWTIPQGNIKKGTKFYVYSQVKGQKVGKTNIWYRTISGGYVWAGGLK